MRPYVVAATSAARRTAAARGPLMIRLAFYLVILGVLSALWKAATAAAGGVIAGYDYEAVFWYLVMAEACVIAVDPRMIERIGADISSGDVTSEMLRPVSVAGLRMAAGFGEVITRFGLAVIAGGAFGWMQAGPPVPSAALMAIASGVLAVACNLAAQHAFAAMSFWANDSKAAWFLYQKLVFLLGGMLIPLEMLPGWLQKVAWVMPFWTMSYAPGRIVSGHADPILLLGQVLWLPVLTAVALGIFALGERRLEVAGG